jgi:hypothetical protein
MARRRESIWRMQRQQQQQHGVVSAQGTWQPTWAQPAAPTAAAAAKPEMATSRESLWHMQRQQQQQQQQPQRQVQQVAASAGSWSIMRQLPWSHDSASPWRKVLRGRRQLLQLDLKRLQGTPQDEVDKDITRLKLIQVRNHRRCAELTWLIAYAAQQLGGRSWIRCAATATHTVCKSAAGRKVGLGSQCACCVLHCCAAGTACCCCCTAAARILPLLPLLVACYCPCCCCCCSRPRLLYTSSAALI